MTSVNDAVILNAANLNWDKRMSTQIIASDSTAAGAGRHSSSIQKKLSRPQNRRNVAHSMVPLSLPRRITRATRWIATRHTIPRTRRHLEGRAAATAVAIDIDPDREAYTSTRRPGPHCECDATVTG